MNLIGRLKRMLYFRRNADSEEIRSGTERLEALETEWKQQLPKAEHTLRNSRWLLDIAHAEGVVRGRRSTWDEGQ